MRPERPVVKPSAAILVSVGARSLNRTPKRCVIAAQWHGGWLGRVAWCHGADLAFQQTVKFFFPWPIKIIGSLAILAGCGGEAGSSLDGGDDAPDASVDLAIPLWRMSFALDPTFECPLAGTDPVVGSMA